MSVFAPATLLACAAFFTVPLVASAQDSTWITDTVIVQKVVSQIPMVDKDLGYKSIWDRLPNLGLRVEAVKIERVRKGEEEPPIYRVGDQIIKIQLTKPNTVVTSICPIVGYPEYVKRGGKYIPQNLTAKWLMTNQCIAP